MKKLKESYSINKSLKEADEAQYYLTYVVGNDKKEAEDEVKALEKEFANSGVFFQVSSVDSSVYGVDFIGTKEAVGKVAKNFSPVGEFLSDGELQQHIKPYLNENLENLETTDNTTVVPQPMGAAEEESKTLWDRFIEATKEPEDAPLFGAEDQPVPDEVEEPEAELEESFEKKSNKRMVEGKINRDCYKVLQTALAGLQKLHSCKSELINSEVMTEADFETLKSAEYILADVEGYVYSNDLVESFSKLTLDESLFESEKNLKETSSNKKDSLKKFKIEYGKGRPGGESEVLEFPSYKEARAYAANHAQGWGFEVKPINESLEDDADFEEFAKNNPQHLKNFDRKKWGKYFDKDGHLIPELRDEYFKKTLKDVSL